MKKYYLPLLTFIPFLVNAQIGFGNAVNTISAEVKGALSGLTIIITVFFAYKVYSKYQEEQELSTALKHCAGYGVLVLVMLGLVAFVSTK